MENQGVGRVPVLRMRVKGALLVLPFRVYKLTVYAVPGCKPEGGEGTRSKTPAKVTPVVSAVSPSVLYLEECRCRCLWGWSL